MAAFCGILSALAFAGLVSAQTPAGYVLGAQKDAWTAKSADGKTRTLSQGGLIYAGDQLSSNPPGAALSLVMSDGTYRRCAKEYVASPTCKPFTVPAAPETPKLLKAFFDRLSNKNLPPLASVTSRGAEGTPPVQLRDAVLQRKGEIVDFADAVSAPPPSDLHLLLEPMELSDSCPLLQVKLTAHTREAGLPGLKPACFGIYQLSSTDQSMETALPATVLFVQPAQFETASKMLAEAADRASQWQGASEAEKRTFLRVTLSAVRQTLGR